MEPIRIAFAEVSRMLRDILLSSLADEAGIVFVGDGLGFEDLLELVAQDAVDIVIVGVPDCDVPVSHYRLFDAHPRIRILTIADHGRYACLYELRLDRTVLRQGSPQQLVQFIRSHVEAHDGWVRPMTNPAEWEAG